MTESELAVEARKAAALESIAESIQNVADALLQVAAVNRQDVARGLNNVGAAIANLDLGSKKEDRRN